VRVVPRIVAVNRFYWPDHAATSQLLTDLCEDLAATGAEVVVIASRKRYDDPSARLAREEVRAGVRVHRVPATRFGRDVPALRAIDYASFYVTAFIALLRELRRGDTVLAKTDPPLLSVAAALAARLRRARLVNWVQDVFPELAGALGMGWANGPVGAVLRRLRDWSVRVAATNVVIAEDMATPLVATMTPHGRVRVIANWCCEGIRPVAHERNQLRAAWKLEGRRVIAYSGNLGRAHAPAAVADLVRRTARLERLTWVFIGGGAGLAAVREAAADSGADVRFLPYQPRERLSESLSAADLHLVSLDPACEGLVMPSKLMGVLAAGRGVVALGDPDGALAREVRAAGCGLALDIAHPEGWASAVEALLDEWETAGARASARAEAGHGARRQLAAWRAVLLGTEPQPPMREETSSPMIGADTELAVARLAPSRGD